MVSRSTIPPNGRVGGSLTPSQRSAMLTTPTPRSEHVSGGTVTVEVHTGAGRRPHSQHVTHTPADHHGAQLGGAQRELLMVFDSFNLPPMLR